MVQLSLFELGQRFLATNTKAKDLVGDSGQQFTWSQDHLSLCRVVILLCRRWFFGGFVCFWRDFGHWTHDCHL